MTYKEVLDYWLKNKPIRSGKTLWLMIAKAIEKQIPQRPLSRLTVDDGIEVIGTFCPCCHAVLDRAEIYIGRCRCGQAIERSEEE